MDAPTPRIGAVERAFVGAEALLLAVVGGLLFLAADWTQHVWPWELTPFNARFFGAFYLASLVAVGVLAVLGRPARLVRPLIALFTTVILVGSLVSTGTFDTDRPATLAWAVIFVAVPLSSAYFLLTAGREADAPATPSALRALLAVQAAATGVYGVLMLAAPTWATGFWPWPVDAFHGRLYSAVFLTLALGSLLLLQRVARIELATLGWTQIVLGVAAVAGLLLTDADVDRVDWRSAGTWWWVGAFAAIGLAGVALIVAPGRLRAAFRPDRGVAGT